MANVHRSGLAERDLLNLWHFIATDNRNAADRTVNRISAAIEDLGRFPKIGRLQPQYGVGLRRIVVGKYLVFYRIWKNQDVCVIRVLHGARNLNRIFRKRKKR